MVPTPHATQGDLPNYTNLLDEPSDHGIGRSRGGLTSKVHLACDGAGRPLSVLVGPGQAGDSPMFGLLLEGICVPRIGGGAPRRRPDEVRAERRTHPRLIENCCAARESRPSFPRGPIRWPTARTKAAQVGGHRTSMRSPTRGAMWWKEPSTRRKGGERWQPGTTSLP